MYVGLSMAAITKEPRIEGVFQVFKRKRYGSGGESVEDPRSPQGPCR